MQRPEKLPAKPITPLLYRRLSFIILFMTLRLCSGSCGYNRTMSNSGILSDPLGKVGDLGKQMSKGVGDEARKVEKTAKQQVGLENHGETDSKIADNAQNQVPITPSSQDTLEIIKKMYEVSNTKVNVPTDNIISKVIEENPKKTPEEIQKMAATRQQLWRQQHKDTYYDPTFNPAHRQEERPGEKREKEEEKKQMETLQVEEAKKKELPPSVKQGSNEKYPGASG